MVKCLKMKDASDSYTITKKDIFSLPMRVLAIGRTGCGKSSIAIREAELESHKKQSQEQEKTHLKTVEEIKLGYQEATRTLQAAARENERAYSALELRYQQQIDTFIIVIK